MYRFAIIDGQNDNISYNLEFRVCDPTAKQWLTGVWQKLSTAVQNAEKAKGQNPPDWCAWQPGAWAGLTGRYESRRTHVAHCGDDIVGFLNVWHDYQSQHEDATVLYVEHVGVFPGSLRTNLWLRKYRFVGTALLAYAINLSQDLGYNCRVGLHSENDDSTAFYKKTANLHPDQPLFFPDKSGVIGPTPHGRHTDGRMLYLETRPDGARAFLEDYNDD